MSTAPLPPATGDYEVDRRRHMAALLAGLAGDAAKLTWPLERLHALRDERLRVLVRVAKEHSPWHARRLQHVEPAALRGDDLSAIPPMTKADLMEHWDAVVTDRRLSLALATRHLARLNEQGPAYLLDQYHVVMTGGSSALRGVFLWDFAGWRDMALAFVRPRLGLLGRFPPQAAPRPALLAAALPSHLDVAFAATFRIGAAGASFPANLPLSDLVTSLNAFSPTELVAYPSILGRLALEARAGRLRIVPRVLTSVAEPLPPGARWAIETAFAAPLLNGYSASETGSIAHSYPGLPGLYLTEDTAVYEPVDAQNRPVPPGTPAAKLLVTNVINQALPLIRYELTDEVTVLDEPNPGPWTGRRIAEPQGRLDDNFTYAGGLTVHPATFWIPLGRLPEIVEYQVRQTPRGAAVVVQAPAGTDLETLRREMMEALRRAGLADPAVTIASVERLDRLPAGKLKRFYRLPPD